MRSRTIVIASVILAFVFVVSSIAMARGHWRGAGGNCAAPVGLRSMMGLNLSDSQKDKAVKIVEECEINRIKAGGELMKDRDNLRVALQADNVNEQDIRKAYKKLSSTREDRVIARAKMMTEMKSILTPEQLKLWDERKAERSDRSICRGRGDSGRAGYGKKSADCLRW